MILYDTARGKDATRANCLMLYDEYLGRYDKIEQN